MAQPRRLRETCRNMFVIKMGRRRTGATVDLKHMLVFFGWEELDPRFSGFNSRSVVLLIHAFSFWQCSWEVTAPDSRLKNRAGSFRPRSTTWTALAPGNVDKVYLVSCRYRIL
jgi:hypothetical protein